MSWIQRGLMLLGLALGVGVPAVLTVQKESLAESGQTVLLELRPRDPRSLMQGDYHVLAYLLEAEVMEAIDADDGDNEWPKTGHLVIQNDAEDVAHYLRRHQGEALEDGELLLQYRIRGGNLRLGAEDFFFQEGTGEIYSRARYGELKVTAGGEALLVGLRGEDFKTLGPPEANPLQRAN